MNAKYISLVGFVYKVQTSYAGNWETYVKEIIPNTVAALSKKSPIVIST